MKPRFKLKQCGPVRGDETAPYEVTFSEPLTVKDFVSDVLSNKEEWGYIGISKERTIFGDPNCEYRWGKLLSCLPPEYLSKKIVSAEASGGWSRMDYLLTVEEDLTDSQIICTKED